MKIYISDWIYETIASLSVYRSYAKCVLGTKTLTFPTQDNGWLSRLPQSSAIVLIIILSRGLIQPARANKKKVFFSRGLFRTLLVTEGVVSKQSPSYPPSFDPQAWSTHPQLRQTLGYPAVPTKTASPLQFGHRTGLEPGCARYKAKT